MTTIQIILLIYLSGSIFMFFFCNLVRYIAGANSFQDKRITFIITVASWLGLYVIIRAANEMVKERKKKEEKQNNNN